MLLHDLAQQLPAGPRLLAELGRLVRAPETDAREVVALLRRDASLVSRLLRMANSAAYARAEPIGRSRTRWWPWVSARCTAWWARWPRCSWRTRRSGCTA
ncbi:HDOD domain-containing protein [Oleiharenicola sp. Vm1]|uniref:HDOD domain-containing protein n=1 Tax=Oleiharenicola sp. Vm1 TaxID=3398393 RepID=UPI0039F4C38A